MEAKKDLSLQTNLQYFVMISFFFFPNRNHHFVTQLHSIQFRHSVESESLWSYRVQHTRLPCPSPTPGARSNSFPLVSDAIQPSYPLCPLLLPPSIFPSIRVFSNESVHIWWPKYWSFNSSHTATFLSKHMDYLKLQVWNWQLLFCEDFLCQSLPSSTPVHVKALCSYMASLFPTYIQVRSQHNSYDPVH